MSEIILQVVADGESWRVGCDLPLEPTFFHSGAQARQMARNLALRLSDAGRDVKLEVIDPAHQTVATHRYFAL